MYNNIVILPILIKLCDINVGCDCAQSATNGCK